jgi:hypothetical protein
MTRAGLKVRGRMNGHWPLIGAAVLCALIAGSDFVPMANRFWSGHQVFTGMVAQIGLALVAIVGLDRLIAKREARKWRPLALMVVKHLERGIDDFDQTLQERTLGYCLDRYGAYEVPIGREYPAILLEALTVESTWEPIAEFPALLPELADYIEESKSKFETWAPLLVADTSLAEIGACATTVHGMMEKAFVRLEYLCAAAFHFQNPISSHKYLQMNFAVLQSVTALREEVERFQVLAAAFRNA